MSALPPECEELLISGYVLGNLSSAEAQLFEEMLSENPQLGERVAALQEVLDFAYAPPEISPPPALRDRILAAANAQRVEEVEQTPTASEVVSPLTPKLLGRILGIFAIAIIALLGIVNYRLWQTVRTTQTESESEIEQNTYLLRGEDLPSTTVAKLVVNREELNATFLANNLPVLPPNKVYALWTVVGTELPYTTDAKGAILTAVFQVDESGDFSEEIAVPQPHLEPRTIQKIAITVEDLSAPQAHAGSIFMSTQ